MLLESPRYVKYPWRVTDLLRHTSEEVQKGTALFSYSVKQLAPEYDADGVETQVEKTLLLRFESATDGSIVQWKIQKGDTIDRPGAPLVEINEPCTHEVQFGGMCANCGKDMTERDYNTTKLDVDRAGVSMAHASMQLKISKEQAAKEEDDAKRRLLHSRRLSLVVDLDQTVLQATVDPTVVEWQGDPENPNYEAVKDVRSFELAEVDLHGRIKRKSAYYIKLRPGLADFLQNMSKLYELHIYTMGTTGYAQEIAKIIDPDRKIFGDRILSRDENGIPNAKTLQRLFPTDTKMVVIIDDRVDVWNWIDNQIKVKPYDFFVGIGDIHGRFAGPAKEAKSKAKSSRVTPVETSKDDAPPSPPASTEPSGTLPTLESILTLNDTTDLASLEQKTAEQDEALAAQVTDRPLLQRQQILDQEEEESKLPDEENSDDDEQHPHKHRNLLQNDDVELYRLGEILEKIHNEFYGSYDRNRASVHDLRVAKLRGERATKKKPMNDLEHLPDVKDIMIDLKQETLDDVVLSVSGLWAQHTKFQDTDLGYWATRFGATFSPEITKQTTHLISKPGKNTAKVKLAQKHRVRVITEKWLYESVNQWRKLNVTPYLIDLGPDATGAVSAELKDLQDEAGASDDGGASENDGLVLKTDLEPSIAPEEEESPQSPVRAFTSADFADGLAELDDMTDDDDEEDTGSDAESFDSEVSEQKDQSKKRKRTASIKSTDAEDSDTPSSNGNADLASTLQKRKRKAFARTSSLTQSVAVHKASVPLDVTPATTHEPLAPNDGEEEYDDAAFAAAFEEEMEAQLGVDSDGGGQDGT